MVNYRCHCQVFVLLLTLLELDLFDDVGQFELVAWFLIILERCNLNIRFHYNRKYMIFRYGILLEMLSGLVFIWFQFSQQDRIFIFIAHR